MALLPNLAGESSKARSIIGRDGLPTGAKKMRVERRRIEKWVGGVTSRRRW
jgi:hypothetical protein